MAGANSIGAELPRNITENTINLKTFKEKWTHMRENITVEPIMACYILSCVFCGLACQNLHLEKACLVNLNFSVEVCEALKRRDVGNYTEEEEAVQLLTASIQGWRNIVQTAMPSVLILFVGAWSDKTGRRKACILTPIVGEFFNCTGFILNTYFFYEIPLEWSLVFEVSSAVTGGWFTMCMGVFSYIGDVTSEEARTFRVGIANLCMSLGIPLGMALSGIMLRLIGYYGIFIISDSLYVISFIYGYVHLKDPEISKEKRKAGLGGVCGFMTSLFDLSLVRETFTVAFRRGDDNRRLRVALLIVVVCVVFGPIYGEMSIMYLFTRYRFNWDEVQFSLFSTYGVVTHLLGTLFSISVFSDVMKLDDSIVGIISSMSKILSSFVYAFATNTLEVYMAPMVEIFNGTSFIAMRSIASKLVSSGELGKVNSLFGLAEALMPLLYGAAVRTDLRGHPERVAGRRVATGSRKVNSLFGLAEALMPLLYGPLYARTYMATLSVLPGAVFLLGGAMTVPAVAIFGWFYFEHKNDIKKRQILTTRQQPC